MEVIIKRLKTIRFISFNKTKGNDIILGKNARVNVITKGRAKLEVKYIKVVDVLILEGLQQNIVSVIQMNDR